MAKRGGLLRHEHDSITVTVQIAKSHISTPESGGRRAPPGVGWSPTCVVCEVARSAAGGRCPRPLLRPGLGPDVSALGRERGGYARTPPSPQVGGTCITWSGHLGAWRPGPGGRGIDLLSLADTRPPSSNARRDTATLAAITRSLLDRRRHGAAAWEEQADYPISDTLRSSAGGMGGLVTGYARSTEAGET